MYCLKKSDNIKYALAQEGVVYFNSLGFSSENHLDLARKLGTIQVTKFFQPVLTHPIIALVEKKPKQTTAIGEFLHTDHSYDLAPAACAILVARKLPATGGDTIFVDMHAAYEQLSVEMKRKIENLRAYHSSKHTFRDQGSIGKLLKKSPFINPDQTNTVLHPIVIQHPITGRKALYVNPVFTTGIEGLSTKESTNILKILYETAVQPQNLIRFKWTVGDVVLWDNRSVWHLAVNDYAGQHRVMHRISIGGTILRDSRGRFRSETVVTTRDPLRLRRRGQIPHELPYVKLLHSTTLSCVKNVEGEAIEPWWQISNRSVKVVRLASFFGINVSKL